MIESHSSHLDLNPMGALRVWCINHYSTMTQRDWFSWLREISQVGQCNFTEYQPHGRCLIHCNKNPCFCRWLFGGGHWQKCVACSHQWRIISIAPLGSRVQFLVAELVMKSNQRNSKIFLWHKSDNVVCCQRHVLIWSRYFIPGKHSSSDWLDWHDDQE